MSNSENRSPETSDRTVINFSHRTTEKDWIQLLDRFALASAPVWFDWLAWILTVAAFQYVLKKSHSLPLSIVLAVIIFVSCLLLWTYSLAISHKFLFLGIPGVKRFSERTQWIVSMLISGVLAFASYQTAITLARVVAQNQQ